MNHQMNHKSTIKELEEFDWLNHKNNSKAIEPVLISIMDLKKEETSYDRKMRMLTQLQATCLACSMCELGLKQAVKKNEARDPHVLSNMNPTRFMVVGQGPGWNELKKREPFVGEAGANFDEEILKHDISRSDFYICNTIRCFVEGNAKPSEKQQKRCEPFLQMELNLIKPKLVITLGAVAFGRFCPDTEFKNGLKKITKSSVYGVPVFAIYHPSPLNFIDKSRRSDFNDQIRVMCALVKRLK